MIKKSILLKCPADRAFTLFTEEPTNWWPSDRRHTQDAQSELTMLATGRFWERARDGREVELGKVRVWEPGRRLVFDFYIGSDPEHPTEVVVTFAPEGNGTRVTIEHRPTPASNELWQQRTPLFEKSWTAVLDALARATS